MHRACTFALLFAVLPLVGQAPPPPAPKTASALEEKAPIILCSGEKNAATHKTDPQCHIPPADRKRAEHEFKQGLNEREQNNFRTALDHFDTASHIAPREVLYSTAVEVARQQLVRQTMTSGNDSMRKGDSKAALNAFRSAAEIDPANDFAKQRLRDVLASLPATQAETAQSNLAAAITLRPDTQTHSIHFRGNTQQLLEQLARTYGLIAFVDESVLNRPVRADIEDATWDQALRAINRLTRTTWTALAPNQILFAANDEQSRRMLLRTSLRTFYVSQASTAQQLNDLANSLRVLFDIRFVVVNPAQNTITVRAPQQVVEAATAFLKQLETTRPQVMLDIEAFEVSETVTRQLGINPPSTFVVFNVPTEAQKLLGGQSIQDILNQLNAGSLNLSNAAALGALLGQGLQASLLAQPFAVFGGGITLTGVVIPAVSAQFSRNSSTVQSLEHLTLRAAQNSPAILKIGTRYPILTSTYSNIYTTSGLPQNSAVGLANYPSYTYEDLGVNVKATPFVHRSGDVQLDLEIQLRALGGQGFPGIPIISNREYKGVISAQDGAQVIVAGQLSHSEQLGIQGVPLLHMLPGAGYAFKQEQKMTSDSELIIVITPHILTGIDPPEAVPITVPDFIPR